MVKVRQKLQTEKFDFDRFKRRHVLLRVSYFGWDYMGFATQVRYNLNIIILNNLKTMETEFVVEQEDAGKSIESELFAALLQTKLVRSREESNYHR